MIAALGGEGKLGIEGGHAVNLFQRNAQALGDLVLNLNGQVAIDLLRLVEGRHHSALFLFQAFNDSVELLRLLGSIMKRQITDTLLHGFSSQYIVELK